MYLASIADSNQNLQNLLPPPGMVQQGWGDDDEFELEREFHLRAAAAAAAADDDDDDDDNDVNGRHEREVLSSLLLLHWVNKTRYPSGRG